MKKFITKNKTFFNILIALIDSIVLGVYLSLVSNYINEGYSFIHSLISPKRWWVYALLFVVCTFFQIYIEIFLDKENDAYKLEIVNGVLKAACDSFIYPMKYHIRAIITVCDYKTKTRKTVYSYNISASPERHAVYDLYFGTTGEAVKRKIPIVTALEANHVETYDETMQLMVEPELRSILAAPIFSVNDDNKVIGVLAFDSFETVETLKFDKMETKNLAQSWADVISKILNE